MDNSVGCEICPSLHQRIIAVVQTSHFKSLEDSKGLLQSLLSVVPDSPPSRTKQ